MKVLFTIWAKVGQRNNGKEEQRNKGTQKRPFAPDKKLDEKNSPKYLHIKIIVVLLRYEN